MVTLALILATFALVAVLAGWGAETDHERPNR